MLHQKYETVATFRNEKLKSCMFELTFPALITTRVYDIYDIKELLKMESLIDNDTS